jgi:hypothetical protein
MLVVQAPERSTCEQNGASAEDLRSRGSYKSNKMNLAICAVWK